MRRIIVTGANGAGKSHFAARLHAMRPDVPIVSFDAIKLTTDWQQRPRAEIDANLHRALQADAWILEGGPSMLPIAIARADGLVWLDPPEGIRAWRLLSRPWKSLGQNRPELPDGNRDWPVQQYKFALRSLLKRKQFRQSIGTVVDAASHLQTWHCRTEKDAEQVIATWIRTSDDRSLPR